MAKDESSRVELSRSLFHTNNNGCQIIFPVDHAAPSSAAMRCRCKGRRWFAGLVGQLQAGVPTPCPMPHAHGLPARDNDNDNDSDNDDDSDSDNDEDNHDG